MDEDDLVKLFIQNSEHYDKEGIELKSILSLTEFKKNERLADLGTGVGRLSIPLSEYVQVTAIDSSKLLTEQIKKTNMEIIHKKIEEYYPLNKFDYALIAWPSMLNYAEIFEHVKTNILKEGGKIIGH